MVRHPPAVLRMTDYRARKSGSSLRGYRFHLAYINKVGRKDADTEGDHPIESASVNYAEEESDSEIKSWFCGGGARLRARLKSREVFLLSL